MLKGYWTDAWARTKMERALKEHYSLLENSPPKQTWKLFFVREYLSQMGKKKDWL